MSELPDATAGLTPEDLAHLEAMMATRSRTGEAVYRRIMAHPGLTRRLAEVGGFLRYEGVLPDDLREMLILATAAHRRSAYEWVMHEPIARAAGVAEEAIEALRAGETPLGLDPLRGGALTVAADVLARRPVAPAGHAVVEAAIGVPGLIEVVYLVAFYDMFAAGLTAFEIPLPEGSPDPFG